MGVSRTSRSRLTTQRWVRVERRSEIYDGMYGTLPTFSTIIERYWLRIYPQQHPQRSRVELGESPDNTTHAAVADLTQNGRTVMVGDRFVDTVNSMTYDVVEVRRPKGGSSYNLMVRYGLVLLSDGPYTCQREAEAS